MILVVDVPQTVNNHGVDHFPVTHALTITGAIEHVRRQAHALLTAGNDNFAVTGGNRLRGQHDRFQARAANRIDRQARNAMGQAGLEYRLTRRVLPHAGSEHLTHDDFANQVRRQARAFQHCLDDCSTQFGGWRFGQ